MRIKEMNKYGLNRIKPCPFCGGFSTIAKSSKTYIKGELTKITYCYCTKCDSRGKRFVLNEDGRTDIESYGLAIDCWNRRSGNES